MLSHTPTPWSVDALGYIRGPNNENILEVKENAEFVCVAVNAHDAMLKALKAFVDGEWLKRDPNEVVRMAREALAKAEK